MASSPSAYLRYYLDEHLPPAVAQQLRSRGIDALAAAEVGRAGTGIADEEQLTFAAASRRTLTLCPVFHPCSVKQYGGRTERAETTAHPQGRKVRSLSRQWVVILQTERLLLREFEESDWPAVLAYQSDPRYLRFYPWTHRTEEDARAFVQLFIDYRRQDPCTRFQLAIVLPEEKRLIGNCGFRAQSVDATEGDIGYELDPRYWGHGYATEAARAMLRFGFERFGAKRIRATVIADNTASIRVLEKLGMQEERRIRNHEWMKGRWWDTLIYARTRRL